MAEQYYGSLARGFELSASTRASCGSPMLRAASKVQLRDVTVFIHKDFLEPDGIRYINEDDRHADARARFPTLGGA